MGEDDDYEMAMQALTSYFTPKTNIPFERHVFRQARQTEQESVDQFCTRLRQLAITCDFAAEVENMIRDQVVESCNSHSLRRKLLRERELTLQRAQDIARADEAADRHATKMEGSRPKTDTQTRHSVNKVTYKQNNAQTNKPKQSLCWRCNAPGHFSKECERSKDHVCEQCGIKGHFKICCRTKQNKSADTMRGKSQRGRGRNVNQNVRTVRSESPSGATGHEHFFAISAGEKTETLPLSVENSRIDAIIDSGASCNLMSEAVFDKIQREAGVRFPVSACNRDVYTYASSKPLQIIGECKLKVGVGETGKSTDAHFIIIPDRHITLLGRQSSEILGVLKVGLSVNECETQSKGLADLKEKYPEVFTGLGKLKDYQLKLHLDKSVMPVAPHSIQSTSEGRRQTG